VNTEGKGEKKENSALQITAKRDRGVSGNTMETRTLWYSRGPFEPGGETIYP